MQLDPNQAPSPLPPSAGDNHTTDQFSAWLKIINEIPLGIFILGGEGDSIHLNPRMREHLKLDQMPISPVLGDYFWSRIESLAEDPVQARQFIRDVMAKIREGIAGEFQITVGGNRSLHLWLFQVDPGGGIGPSYAGIALEKADERAVYRRQIKMLEEMSIQARKTSASAVGNLDALSGNLRVWSPEVLEGFLADAREQQNQINQTLDLVLNLIRTYEEVPVFPASVDLIQLVNEVKTGMDQIDLRITAEEDGKRPSMLLIDAALTSMALKYLIQEILIHNPGIQFVDLKLAEEENDLVLSLECPRTLPLPGLAIEVDEADLSEQNVKLYLAKKIIGAQGGTLTIGRPQGDRESISRIEIKLPASIGPWPIKRINVAGDVDRQAIGRILVADAQPEYQIRLRQSLLDQGYRVDLALDGSAALDLTQTINPDLVILSRNLPGLDGLLVTQGIRRWSAVPIIMISERVNPDDSLYAFQLGVDDYLRKPFSIEELLARVRVCLRRSENQSHSLTTELYQSNQIRIDYSTRQVWIRGNPVDLTPIEYNLLSFMSRQGKQIMPYEQLLESVWEGPEKGSRQGLFVHVKRLREKIERDAKNPQIIINKWGVGYVFNP